MTLNGKKLQFSCLLTLALMVFYFLLKLNIPEGFFVFVWFDSLRPINNLSVIKGRVFLGWTSTKLGLMFLLKDTTQRRRWGSNPRPFGLESSALPLSHCAPYSRRTRIWKYNTLSMYGGKINPIQRQLVWNPSSHKNSENLHKFLNRWPGFT